MRVAAGLIALALLWATPGPAQAQAVRFGADFQRSGQLAANEILLLNRSDRRLRFFLSIEDGPWQPYGIGGGDAALIDARRMAIAVGTSRHEGDPAPQMAPRINASSVPAGGMQEGVFDIDAFEGGMRAEMCWNAGAQRWSVQALGGLRC